MSEEDYYKVISISVNGDHTPLLDTVVDNPQIRELSLKDSAGVDTIVYDATAIASFNNAQMWLEENAIPGKGSVCMLLVGNDHNLDDNDVNKVVNTDIGKELARRFKISFIETSAENKDKLEQDLRNMTEFIESSRIYKTGAIQMEG